MAAKSGRNHELVYEALIASGKPLSAYDLLSSLQAHGIAAPLTVYRALDRLLREGRIHKLNSVKAYVACSHPGHHSASTVFAICRDCRNVVELVQPDAVAALRREGAQHGFEADEASVELQGTCADCRERMSAGG
ncbi:MAG: Fur family transcriptional regulator [Methylobacterium sp.]